MKKNLTIFLLTPLMAWPQFAIGRHRSPDTSAPAIEIRSSSIVYSASSTLTVAIPSGTLAGDFCAMAIGSQNILSTFGSGWTQVSTSSVANWGGSWLYKNVTSGDISSGNPLVFTGGGEIVTSVCFVGSTSGYVTSQYDQSGFSSPATNTIPSLSGGSIGYMVLWISSNRASGSNSISRGTLLQTVTAGTNDASSAVFSEILASGFSNSVTYLFGGTYNPSGYYDGFLVVAP